MNDDPLSPNSPQSQRRLFIALALAMALTTLYTFFFAPPPPPPEAAGADAGVAAVTPDAGTAPVAAPSEPREPGTPEAPAEEPPPAAVTLERQRKEATYAFTSDGAGLTSAVLQGKKMREQRRLSIAEGYKLLFGGEVPPPEQMNLAQPVQGEPLPLSVSIEGPQPLPAGARYAVATEEAAPQDGVRFTTRRGPWEVTKTVQWPHEGFELLYTVQVRNTSAQAQSGELKVHYARAIAPEQEHAPSFFGGVGNLSHAACQVADEYLKRGPEDEAPKEELTRGPIQFFGIDQQYFLSALYPLEGPLQGHCALEGSAKARSVTAAFPLSVAAGESVVLRFGGYLGPKDPDFLAPAPSSELLKRAGQPSAAWHPPLENSVDYGIWAVISKVLVTVMKFFHSVTGNWGVAVILLTVLVKLVLLPLTHRSMVSMEGMKKLQPRMEEIRKKYAEDRERQNLEMMKLYQEAKVNPLGGCLPMLIQMPVWIALFTALRNSYDLYGEPFVGPVWQDLTYKDPTYLLPLALGVTMVMTQKLQPQMGDPTQAKLMTWFIPIIFTVTLLQYPSGLALYIFTNNLLSIAQQYGLRKWLERRDGGSGGTPAAAGGKSK